MFEFGRTPFWDESDFGDQASTLIDLHMSRLSYTLRSKPSWWTKYQNPDIRAKWEDEALNLDLDGEGLNFSPSEVKYVLDELAGFAALREEETGIQPSCYWRTWESDSLISEDLRQRLITAIAPLENIPDDKKDWHPGSNEQVLDLIHPSLFCLVYDRTMALPLENTASGKLAVVTAPQKIQGAAWWSVSDKFSWIPTDFNIAGDGHSAKAVSYINNLHPSNIELLAIVEEVVARFSKLFDRVLTDLIPGNGGLHRRIDSNHGYTFQWVDDGREPEPRDEEDDEEFDARYDEWKNNREFDAPTVSRHGYAAAKDISRRKTRYSLQGKQAQVIVKLANIHLTPDRPDYPGGTWHVEGMANERIIASGIYYYDCENIAESHLAFRCAVNSDDIRYEQDDEAGMKRAYGLDRQSESNQYIGEVETKQNRCIAFPNIYQHKVSPFSLADKTRPGHRKIVALFLVDPTTKIPSTTHIPPQQADWAMEAMQKAPDDGKSLFGKLPIELLDLITKNTGTMMTEQEAKQYRLELMEERKGFVAKQGESTYGAPFNMCEH